MTRYIPKKQKAKNNFRKTQFLCPECLSTLKTNKNFHKECSGDRLKLWNKKFKAFKEGKKKEKDIILQEQIDCNKFKELYDKWLKDGKLSCEYTSNYYNILPEDNILVPDPMQLARIEKDLGTLDKTKLTDDTIFYFDGNKYHKKAAKDREPVKLEWIKFPDDL